jgi:hypothetical protein
LGELEISGVGSEQTSGAGAAAGQADLRVDVEHAVCAAGGPDDRCAIGFVVLEVVAADRAVEFVFGAGLQAVLDMTVELNEVEEDHT